MRNDYLNSADCINAIDSIDISKLTFKDVRVHYGTGRSYTVQGNYEKKYFYRNGKKTTIGDIEESVWRDIVRQIISLQGEEELFQDLSAWYSETGGMFRTKSEQELYILELHIVTEDWAINDMYDTNTHLFSNRESAELHMRRLINEFFTYDNPTSWRAEPNFEEESGELYYKAWLDGDYRENHYEVAIIRKTMDLTWDYIHKVGRINNEAYAKEDMLMRITEEDSEIEATDDERQKLIELVNDTDVEGLIEDKLGSADSYWERYWSAVNDVARDLLKGIRGQDE